jgi:hypothetical protein
VTFSTCSTNFNYCSGTVYYQYTGNNFCKTVTGSCSAFKKNWDIVTAAEQGVLCIRRHDNCGTGCVYFPGGCPGWSGEYKDYCTLADDAPCT